MTEPTLNRLQREIQRLYAPLTPGGSDDAGGGGGGGSGAGTDESGAAGTLPHRPPAAPGLVRHDGQVRAAVLGLTGPAGWTAISAVWQGVQSELDLPAPAIAVAGPAGYQLWFSFDRPLPAPDAWAVVDALRQRYLGGVPAHRTTLMPAPDGSQSPPWRHAEPVPAPLADGEHWSAFVAPDLAPMFSEDPWLDLPPSPEGQAELLSRLASISPEALQRALQQLRAAPDLAAPPPEPHPQAAPAAASSAAPNPSPPDATTKPPPTGAPGAADDTWTDPGRFLLAVMNDASVPMALRIEAAKALLPFTGGRQAP